MNLPVTLLFYLTIGLGAAVAASTADLRGGRARQSFLLLTALLFWPLYLPLLLNRERSLAEPAYPPRPTAQDDMAAAIAQVERELAAAFASLDGWAENVLAHQSDRLLELRASLDAQAARIRDMDTLAEHTRAEADALLFDTAVAAGGGEPVDRFRQSQQARTQNLARLAEVRRAAYADLMATLAWIRELVSMIHLAKYTGAPAARAAELVAQIAAAIEGISAATWREEPVLN